MTKSVYNPAEFTVERRPKGWCFTARFDDKPEWRGPYSSKASVRLMIARQLKKEIEKRDARYDLD